MKIQLISYPSNLRSELKRDLTLDLFNNCNGDLILFPGHTLDSVGDLEKIKGLFNNKKKTTAFLEVKEIGARNITNWSFKIKNNRLINCHTHQLFATSNEINNNNLLAESLIHEIKNERLHTVKGKQICLLICGELNILKNLQNDRKERNRVEYRASDNFLINEYKQLFRTIDIFLNPIHTPMGNQGKMAKRREFLSQHKRTYFSTSNIIRRKVLNDIPKSLFYGNFDGKELTCLRPTIAKNFISCEYEVEF